LESCGSQGNVNIRDAWDLTLFIARKDNGCEVTLGAAPPDAVACQLPPLASK
jgi:hypothetical protein